MRIAEHAPPYCSACFQQKPQAMHVDLQVAWDGPVIDEANGVKYPIEDIVLCHACAQAIADMLPDQAKRLKTLEDRTKHAVATAERALEYAESLQDALTARAPLEAVA